MQDAVTAEIAVHLAAEFVEEVIALAVMPVEPAFGGDHDLIAPPLCRLPHKLLSTAQTIARRLYRSA